MWYNTNKETRERFYIMANPDNVANEKFRDYVVKAIKEFFQSEEGKKEDIFQTKTNKLAFPFVNELGNDAFIEITVAVPRGSRDGTPYDGYEQKEDFEAAQVRKIEEAKIQAAKKAKKIAQDKKMREKRAAEKQGE